MKLIFVLRDCGSAAGGTSEYNIGSGCRVSLSIKYDICHIIFMTFFMTPFLLLSLAIYEKSIKIK